MMFNSLLKNPFIVLYLGLFLMLFGKPFIYVVRNGSASGNGFLFYGSICLLLLWGGLRFAHYSKARDNLRFFVLSGITITLLLLLSYVGRHYGGFGFEIFRFLLCMLMFMSTYYLFDDGACILSIWQRKMILLNAFFCIIFSFLFLRYINAMQEVTREVVSTRDALSMSSISVSYMFMGLCIMHLSFGFTRMKRFKGYIFLLCSLICVIVVLSTASKGALIWGGLTAIIMYYSLSSSDPLKLFFRVAYLFAITLCFILIAYYLLSKFPVVGARVEVLTERFSRLVSGDITLATSERDLVYAYYIELMPRWIVIGLRDYGYYIYPHNQWLEFVVRFGLFGLFPLCILLLNFLRTLRVFLLRKIPGFGYFLMGSLYIYSYLFSMTSFSLQANYVLFISGGYMLKANQVLKLRNQKG